MAKTKEAIKQIWQGVKKRPLIILSLLALFPIALLLSVIFFPFNIIIAISAFCITMAIAYFKFKKQNLKSCEFREDESIEKINIHYKGSPLEDETNQLEDKINQLEDDIETFNVYTDERMSILEENVNLCKELVDRRISSNFGEITLEEKILLDKFKANDSNLTTRLNSRRG